MENPIQAAETIAALLNLFISSGELRLKFRIAVRSQRSKALSPEGGDPTESSSDVSRPRSIFVEFTGPDTMLLTSRNGELLNALEHIAVKALRLESDEHDLVAFDADNFKADRDAQLRASAEAAVERVQMTERPYSFPSMTSRERRMLHLMLQSSGLPTASSGEGPARFVVLYPLGGKPAAEDGSRKVSQQEAETRVRAAFRRR